MNNISNYIYITTFIIAYNILLLLFHNNNLLNKSKYYIVIIFLINLFINFLNFQSFC